jgi:hypothetical protein
MRALWNSRAMDLVVGAVFLGLLWFVYAQNDRNLNQQTCENRIALRAVLDTAVQVRVDTGDPDVDTFRVAYERIKRDYLSLENCEGR